MVVFRFVLAAGRLLIARLFGVRDGLFYYTEMICYFWVGTRFLRCLVMV